MCIYIYIHTFKKYVFIYTYVDVYTFLHQLPVGSLVVAVDVDEEVNELLPSRSKIFPTIPCHEQ